MRLAITPRLDGRLADEEWDRFAVVDGVQTYFQWEPGKLHGAASLPVGKDLVASFDTKGDGWMVGADNLEVRVSWNMGAPVLKARILNVRDPRQPGIAGSLFIIDDLGPQKWVEAKGFEEGSRVGASSNGTVWTVEFTAEDPGSKFLPTAAKAPFTLRMDPVDTSAAPAEPNGARTMAPVSLMFDRATNLPEGMKWKPEYEALTVVPGDSNRIRLAFNGSDEMGIQRIEVRTEGLGREFALSQTLPFPQFDAKGRAFVDYETPIGAKAPEGYRLVRGTLSDATGAWRLVQCSYHVAPLLEFDLPAPRGLKSRPEEQKVRVSIYVRSNTRNRVDGVLKVEPPSGWEITSGPDPVVVIYHSRGSVRRVVDFKIPAGAQGSFPVKVTVKVGDRDVAQTLWLRVM